MKDQQIQGRQGVIYERIGEENGKDLLKMHAPTGIEELERITRGFSTSKRMFFGPQK
jgi:hypothetical protein